MTSQDITIQKQVNLAYHYRIQKKNQKRKIIFHTAALIAGLLSAVGTVVLLQANGIAWTWYIVAATAMNMVVAVGLNAFLTKSNRVEA